MDRIVEVHVNDGQATLEYKMCFPPLSLTALTNSDPNPRSRKDMDSYVAWLQESMMSRWSYLREILTGTGLVSVGLDIEAFASSLDSWLGNWIPLIFELPEYRDGWITEVVSGRAIIRQPGMDLFSPRLHNLMSSLAHDIAFAIFGKLSETREVRWIVQEDLATPSGLHPRLIAIVASSNPTVEPVLESYFSIREKLALRGSRADAELQDRWQQGWSRLGALATSVASEAET